MCGERPFMRVLIIKISAIGDTIMTLPIVAALRRRYPTASIAWLCSGTTATVVRLVDEIEVISVNEGRLFQGSLPEKLSEVVSVWRKLRRRRYDLVVVGHTNPLFRVLTLSAFVSEWRSLSSLRPVKSSWAVPGRYHADE